MGLNSHPPSWLFLSGHLALYNLPPSLPSFTIQLFYHKALSRPTALPVERNLAWLGAVVRRDLGFSFFFSGASSARGSAFTSVKGRSGGVVRPFPSSFRFFLSFSVVEKQSRIRFHLDKRLPVRVKQAEGTEGHIFLPQRERKKSKGWDLGAYQQAGYCSGSGWQPSSRWQGLRPISGVLQVREKGNPHII